MGLKRDIEEGSDIAGQMIDDNSKGAIYTMGLESTAKKHTPKILNWGCLPIAIGTGVAVFQEIRVGATEHIIPTVTAAVILLGLGSVLRKIKQAVNSPNK